MAIKLGRKIKPIFTWNDLVLPDDQIKQLKEITNRIRNEHKVNRGWGYGKSASAKA